MFGAVLLTLLSGSLQTITQERLANVAQQIDVRYSPDLRNIVRCESELKTDCLCAQGEKEDRL